jgi:Family of unknown function (DUF5519)
VIDNRRMTTRLDGIKGDPLRASGTIGEQIAEEVSSWDGVVAMPHHRFGGVEFKVGRREIGHLHGSRLADIPFPVAIREQLVAEGRAKPHHVLPKSGWISYWIRGRDDVPAVIELFRMSYQRPWIRRERCFS